MSYLHEREGSRRHKLSTPLYLGGYVGALVFAVFGSLGVYVQGPGVKFLPFAGMFLAGLLLASVVVLRFWYRAWASLADGRASTSPLLAVGLMFVPVFNLYWVFRLSYGFARDFNAYIKRWEFPVEPLGTVLFLAFPVMYVSSVLLGAVPLVAFLLVLGCGVAQAVIMVGVCARVNSCEDPLAAQRPERSSTDGLWTEARGVGGSPSRLAQEAARHVRR